MLHKPEHCRPCPLFGNGYSFSKLEGSGQSGLMVVAEALGKSEEKDGLPLRPYAKAGEVYQRIIDDINVSRGPLTLTNIVRCRPPGNELGGAPYERAAIAHCATYLDEAVEERSPRVILALGAIPLRELAIEPYSSLPQASVRGFILPSRYGIPVIGTYHPSHIARGAWNLYGVMLNDHTLASSVARNGPPVQLETRYELSPSLETARAYLRHLLDNSLLPVAYDVETAGILGEPEPADWKLKRIVQIQFSHRAGYAIVFPWEGEFISISRSILALSNPKWGWNSRTSDDIVLIANGCPINGERHDLMLAWGHLQPDFAGGKDEHEEKGIPARLMGLQACTSFFAPEVLPWKHDHSDLPLYGAYDADYTLRCGQGIFSQLTKRGLLAGYQEYKYRQRFVLDDLGQRGLPVDRAAQASLAAFVASEEARISAAIQRTIPIELRGIHPKGRGYKTLPKKLKAVVENGYDPTNPPIIELSNNSGHLVCEDGVWMLRLLFNVNSHKQLLSYLNYMEYPIPKHINTGADTTNALGIEQLLRTHDDEILRLTQQDRKLSKLGGTYAKGDWVPGADGRVHGTFGMLTGSGQTTCKAPNVQQYPEHYDPKIPWLAELMHRVKAAIKAEPGHVLIKVDLRSFHARMQGFLAEDAVYYKMADFDLHSYITAHYMELEDAHHLIQLSDDELRTRLKQIKSDYQFERNFKVKRTTFLMQYGGGPEKMFTILQPAFVSVIQVMDLMDRIKQLFPKTFTNFPAMARKMLKGCRVVSPFGCHRFIWDRKIQEGVAFLASNSAHCHVQSALIRLFGAGVFSAYEAVNFAHDSLWMHPLERDADNAIAVVKGEFERPSTVLHNQLGAFYCHADAQVGYSMDAMKDV